MIIDAIENGVAVTIEVEEPGSAIPATRVLGSSRGLNNRGRHERGMFRWNDLVTHEIHGTCRVIEEWGMFYSCRDCYKVCDGAKCNRCGGWTYQVSGYGVYDVVCPDGKTRSVHQQWLAAASGTATISKFEEIANTEAMRIGTSPPEAESARPPKGLGRDGNKPLMGNRSDDASPIGHTGGDQFTASSGMSDQSWEEIPIIGSIGDDDLLDQIENALMDPDVCMQRDRPYRGQSWTDSGERGKTKVEGLTMRDIRDCFIRGACLAAGETNPHHYAEAEKGESAKLNKDSLYELDWSRIDPGAVAQNMACEIERVMGIFPNLK